MPPPAEFVALAQRAAEAHALWPELVCAIVEQESAWNPWALRYEPAFYERYIAPQIARGAIPDVTESRARAFSWGLMQVMGQVAREHGFVGGVARFSVRSRGGTRSRLPRLRRQTCRRRRQRLARAAAMEWGRES